MPAAKLFVKKRKGMERMRATSVCRLAIKTGLLLAALAGCAVLAGAQRPPGARGDEETFRFRFVGPRAGNRVASIAGVPGDPSTYYAGAASGGVWKTTDGGNRWEPIFDKEQVAAIGAIAVAPSDPSVIWVGTGEAWAIRDSDVMGNGVYVSTDSGKSWTHAGLEDTGRIGRIVVHPSNPDIAFVCALGRTTGPQQERGVYRTTDRGQHWERVLFADANTGCSGLAMDPRNPRILLAGMWQVEMHTYGELSRGLRAWSISFRHPSKGKPHCPGRRSALRKYAFPLATFPQEESADCVGPWQVQSNRYLRRQKARAPNVVPGPSCDTRRAPAAGRWCGPVRT